MSIIATCPTSPSHERFITVAHVSEDWEVDRHGNFVQAAGGGETVAPPMIGNTWTCVECGAEAEVVERSEVSASSA